ncbi:MAG: alpha/beta hydrolase-fold protein [Polyangiaceae bacterium]
MQHPLFARSWGIRGLSIAGLATCGLLSSCSHGGSAPPDGSAPDTSTSPPAPVTTASAAPAEASKCVDPTHADVVGPDGKHTALACGDDAACVGGACAPLKIPEALGGGSVDRARLLRIDGAGFLGPWSMLGPFDRAQVDSFAKAPKNALDDAKNGGSKPLCDVDGRVDVKPRGGGHLALVGFLVSARPQKVWLKAGIAGKTRVWVANDKVDKIIDLSRTQGLDAIPDDALAPADLAAGPNLVIADVEGGEETPPSFYLRVHDDQQRRPADVAFAPAIAKASCSVAALTALAQTRTVTDDGLDLRFVASFPNLAPGGATKIPYKVELRSKKPVTIVEGEIDPAAADEAARTIAAHVAPAKDGKQTVRVTLGDGDAKDERNFTIHQRKKLFPRVTALVKALASMPATLPSGSRDSFERDVTEMADATAQGHPDESWITGRVDTLEKLADAMARGEDPYRTKTGVVYRAYRSELDGKLQPYVVYIPPSHKPDGAAMPMIVAFHGLTHQGEHALRAVIGEAAKEDDNPDAAARHLPGFSNMGAILVAPWGFGKAGPKQLGEADILRVIDEMKAAYRVDPTRVSITGYSLGGTVAFALPLHYPSIFSAAAPLCGYPNLTTYQSVKDVQHTDFEDAMIARRFLGNYAANGMALPLHIVHGGQDGPQRSAVMAQRYKQLGYSAIFDVQDDLAHNVWDYAYKDGVMVQWLKKKQQPRPPHHVHLVTGEYRYDRSYWIRLLGMQRSPGAPGTTIEKTDQPDALADIDARMDWPAKELTITTRNVESFALDVAQLGPVKGSVAKIDGAVLPIDETAKEVFFVRDDKGSWSAAPSEPSRLGRKRAGVSGPLDDILRHPQLIVVGTEDPSQTETNRVVAEHFSSADQWASAHFPIKLDRDVTEADLTGKSLVLIGNPASNRVTALFAKDLPAQFEPNAITFRGKRYEGDDLAISFIYPHPRDPKEYVVVHAGTTFKGTLASRSLPQLAPDFLIYDRKLTVMRGELLLDRRGPAVKEGGFFDEGWK